MDELLAEGYFYCYCLTNTIIFGHFFKKKQQKKQWMKLKNV